MSNEQTIAFLLFAVVAAITPGPSNIILASAGATAGVLRGIPCLLGVVFGMGLMMFLVAFGLGRLVLENEWLLGALRWCGGAFLLWLAWKIASARAGEDHEPNALIGFRQAAAFQWVSPKSWLICASAIGAYRESGGQRVILESAYFAGLFSAAALPSCAVWLAFGGALQRVLRTERSIRRFNRVMGAALAGSVLLLIR